MKNIGREKIKLLVVDSLAYLSFGMVTGFCIDLLAGINGVVAIAIALTYAPLQLLLGGPYGKTRDILKSRINKVVAEVVTYVLFKTTTYLFLAGVVFKVDPALAMKSLVIGAVLLPLLALGQGKWMDVLRGLGGSNSTGSSSHPV